jgi:hypothetical protein
VIHSDRHNKANRYLSQPYKHAQKSSTGGSMQENKRLKMVDKVPTIHCIKVKDTDLYPQTGWRSIFSTTLRMLLDGDRFFYFSTEAMGRRSMFPLHSGMPWGGDRVFHFPTLSYGTEIGNFQNASVYHRQITVSNILLRSDLLCCTHKRMVFYRDNTSLRYPKHRYSRSVSYLS